MSSVPEENKKSVSEILANNDIKIFGFCKFDKIKNNLLPCRAKDRLPQNLNTIMSVAFPYKVPVEGGRNISRYAVVKDYHKVVIGILNNVVVKLLKMFPENLFVPFVDNSPVPEVKTAVLAGLGVMGKNGLLITPKYGSWVFVGEIVTDLDISCQERKVKTCIKCNKCEDSCPTGALSHSTFNKDVCLSYISQKKGELSDFEKKSMKEYGLVFGCDICQEVCPMNKGKPYTYLNEFLNSSVPFIRCNDYHILSDRAFMWRPSHVIERNIKLVSLQEVL